MKGIFSSFRFGSLIKTFLPGFILFTASLFLLDCFLENLGVAFSLSNHIQAYSEIFLLFFIPLSLIFGITCNTIIFAGLNDLLIRKPHQKSVDNKELYKLKQSFFNVVSQKYFMPVFPDISFSCDSGLDRLEALNTLDIEIVLETLGDREDFYALRESYWYYLEYQMNMAVAVSFLGLAIFVWLATNPNLRLPQSSANATLFTTALLTISHFLLVLKAAKRNYDRHVRKMFSLMLAVFVSNYEQNQESIE